jgi:hypothetical protein
MPFFPRIVARAEAFLHAQPGLFDLVATTVAVE